MYKLCVSDLAHEDLEHIIVYIAVELANPGAAGELLNEIEKCYQNLRLSPLMYAECLDTRLAKDGYRRAVIKNYLMLYTVDEAAKTVYVSRYFYGARDYARLV